MGFWKRSQGLDPEEDRDLKEEIGSRNGGQNRIQNPSMWRDEIGHANFDQDQAFFSFENTNLWSMLNQGGSFKERMQFLKEAYEEVEVRN